MLYITNIQSVRYYSVNTNYTLAGNFSSAFIRISDITGNNIKTFDVKSGTGSITVNASDLGAGLFLYSLIVDDNIADTKKMVVTQ